MPNFCEGRRSPYRIFSNRIRTSQIEKGRSRDSHGIKNVEPFFVVLIFSLSLPVPGLSGVQGWKSIFQKGCVIPDPQFWAKMCIYGPCRTWSVGPGTPGNPKKKEPLKKRRSEWSLKKWCRQCLPGIDLAIFWQQCKRLSTSLEVLPRQLPPGDPPLLPPFPPVWPYSLTQYWKPTYQFLWLAEAIDNEHLCASWPVSG